MSSAEFLVLQAFLIIAGIAFARWKARQGLPTVLPKVPEQPDAYALAWLAGGDAGVVRLATFDLLRHGYVAVDGSGQVRPQAPPADAAPIDPVAKGVYRTLTHNLQVDSHFFERLQRFDSFSKVLDGYRDRWVALGLANGAERIGRSWRMVGWTVAAFLAIAGARAAEALSHGRHNIGFLILLAVAGCIAAAIIIPVRRVTAQGKRFLGRVRTAHDLDKAHTAGWAQQDQRGAAGDAMLLGVAVLGVGALAGTPWSPMHDAFRHGAGSGSGGCGSGSSCGTGSSSESGGSSDSGGSGCGGGGCGGGGGD